ncbi:unnamed protein product [Spirodela intermedia]|uniref:Uncharacterized protein n=1 Tax=Spirodela intermedia TaxID=51605 RepID=A0A7I8LAK2_SPIIN|nr:unnamed protein product [Spirodela intermedia]
MGCLCSKQKPVRTSDAEENAKIRLLFQTGFDEAELRSYIPVIHANVFQTVKGDGLHGRVTPHPTAAQRRRGSTAAPDCHPARQEGSKQAGWRRAPLGAHRRGSCRR